MIQSVLPLLILSNYIHLEFFRKHSIRFQCFKFPSRCVIFLFTAIVNLNLVAGADNIIYDDGDDDDGFTLGSIKHNRTRRRRRRFVSSLENIFSLHQTDSAGGIFPRHRLLRASPH